MARRISYIDPVSAKLNQQQKGQAFGVSLKPVMRKLDITPPTTPTSEVANGFGAQDSLRNGKRYSRQESDRTQRRSSKMDRWKDKVVVITGASSGIGAATARRLVEEGMIVVGAARRLEKLEELRSQLPSGKFHAVQCDVSVETDIVQLFRTVDKKLGRVDVLINNAGVAHYTSLIEPKAEALEALFAVNVIGPCLCSREFLWLHRERNLDMGYIMFTNSILGHKIVSTETSGSSTPFFYPYSATKHALHAIMEGLRHELRTVGSKVRVGEVSPGDVQLTEISSTFATFGLVPEERKAIDKYKVQQSNTNELMLAEDIADAFVFMLSAPERADVSEIIIHNRNK